MGNETITITKQFADGRIVTATYSSEASKAAALVEEARHQDQKYAEHFGVDSRSIIEAFKDLVSSMEWD